MIVVPVYFNPGRIALWERMFQCWLAAYRASESQMNIVVVTDEITKIPVEVLCMRVPDHAEYCKSPLNKAGWLRAWAAKCLTPCIIMDIDAIVLECIDEMESITAPIALGPDPANRMHKGWPDASPELNCGVMVVNSPKIVVSFFDLWKKYYPAFGHIPMFEELVWTAVLTCEHGDILDRKFNWSHWWDKDKEGVIPKVFHSHGVEKMFHF